MPNSDYKKRKMKIDWTNVAFWILIILILLLLLASIFKGG